MLVFQYTGLISNCTILFVKIMAYDPVCGRRGRENRCRIRWARPAVNRLQRPGPGPGTRTACSWCSWRAAGAAGVQLVQLTGLRTRLTGLSSMAGLRDCLGDMPGSGLFPWAIGARYVSAVNGSARGAMYKPNKTPPAASVGGARVGVQLQRLCGL